jgi:F420-non-reducing hydrogenase iron-sulfur subunit
MNFVKRVVEESEVPKACATCGAELAYDERTSTYDCLACGLTYDLVCEACGNPVNRGMSDCPTCAGTGAKPFEPRIVGFLCNWCSYTGADLAGTSRVQYAPNVRVIRVMCSARIDPTFVIKALAEGADGVLVCGCHPGDCHYVEGNYKTMRRHAALRRVLRELGVEEERVRLEWVSASEGVRFGEIVDDMTAKVRQLGPSRLIRTRAKLRLARDVGAR